MQDTLRPFEAEVGRVLDIVVNSLYREREIFLRELVSNASDACDRLRYESLSEPELLGEEPELRIRILIDRGQGLLTVRDNGIGMNREDLVANLGTIARSGTARFLEALEREKKSGVELIGQFGVGFYAAFMVADRVVVLSRKAGEERGWIWASDGRSGFSVREAEERPPRGTAVTLHLKEDAKEFLDPARIEAIVRRYSDHITFPILLEVRPKPGDTRTKDHEPRRINSASALWTRPRSEITEEQYREFYHHVAHAIDDPWLRVHFTAEGTIAYTALLFVPSLRPFDILDPRRRHGVKLYVKRVFITEALESLLPRYLRFVAGVVDSEDLQLNVSRETLQNNAVVARMRRTLVRRLLDALAAEAKAESGDERDGKKKEGEAGDGGAGRRGFLDWWKDFGPVLKEGLIEDAENRERILEIARFRTTAGGWTDLAGYLDRRRPGQKAIYYISGENAEALAGHPQLEEARARGVEVLLLDDPVDEFWLPEVRAFKGVELVSLTRGEVDLSAVPPAEGKEEPPALAEADLERLIARLRQVLGEAVRDVRVSKRLRESAVCLVAEGEGLDMRLERFLVQHGQIGGLSRRILEINPRHALIRRMAEMAAAADGGAEAFAELALLLLDQARIVEGEPLPDPGAFARRLSRFLARVPVAPES